MTDIDMELLPDYLVEAAEHLEEMETLLLSLADDPESTTLLDEIFRPIHSIKGAAQFIGLERSSRLAHRLEDLLDLLRKGERQSSSQVVELLIAARDLIVRLADELENTQAESSSVENMIEQISAEIEAGETAQSTAASTDEYEEDQQTEIVENPTYKEENDQELFGIFLENLREKLDLLRTQAAELENSADKIALLERWIESIAALQSAANYMGYEELTQLYNNWHEDIVAVQEALGRNEDVPYDFMDGYLSEISSLFPQLGEQTSAVETDVKASDVKAEINQETISEDSSEESTGVDMDMLPDYLVEAAEHLEEMETLLLSLADDPESTTLLDEIFRPIHSIKGAAQFIGLERSSRLAHRLEDLLDLLRKGEHPSSPEVVELLITARDLIVRLADELENTQAESSSVENMIEQISAEIEAGATAQSTAASADEYEEKQQAVIAENPAYEEENDQELFGIFLENLREKLDLLRTQAAELENSADKIALLERCVESIAALQSAANYMGYEELTQLYNNWHEDIVAVQEALGRNEDIPYDFMDGYLSEITSLFPQLGQQTNTTAQTKTKTQIKQDGAESSASVGTTQAVSEKTKEENLYEKLNDALDAASSTSEAAEYELLHGVFEEMISEREEAPTDKQTKETAHSNKPAVEARPVANKKADAGTASSIAEKAKTKPQQPATPKQDKQIKRPDTKQAATRTGSETVVKKSVRVEAEKIDTLINQVGELVVDRAYFHQLFDDMRNLQKHFKEELGLNQKEMKPIRAFTYRMGEAIASLGRTSNELQEGVMKVRMLPISQLFNRYPRLVHDLTRNNNKKVNLVVEGEDTELDKMVVEKLSDPLIHIIRNAIDHGLENASQRSSVEKPETGRLFLKAYHESNQVVVEITDDGRGIDPNLVKAKAIEKGVVSKNEADRMLPHEIIRLITAAGFSTADEITDTSGRGVGMDVVRKNIEKLNGTLDIDSIAGKGTTIRLKIPLTLAIIPAHLVRVGGNMYTIPLANIEETLRIGADETTIIEGTEVVYLRGKTLPVIHLSTLFSTSSKATDKNNFFVVVVNTGTQKMGLVVDELLGQEEVVIKPLVEYLRDKSGFSGATIIGDGSISLILDIYEIVKMTADQQIRRQHERTMARKSGAAGQANQAAG